MSTHSIKGLRAEFREAGKFHTPPELAKFLHDLIPDADQVRDVYDPTCGAGNLLAIFPDSTPKFGQDIDEAALQDARTRLSTFTGHLGDVLENPAWVDRRFHAIVANPPFSVKWEPHVDERFQDAPTVPTQGRADFAFLLHILYMLADDGTAAVLQFPGVLYRGGREQKLRRYLVEELNTVDRVIHLPGKTFEDTTISTCALVLRKDREAGAPIHVEDRENHVSREVPLEEIADNDWTLSPTVYVQPEVEEIAVDTVELNRLAWNSARRQIAAQLAFQRRVCEWEGWDFEPYRADALEIVRTA